LKESGGHRFQRVPPTEQKGRVHTSTVTVVATVYEEKKVFEFRDEDFIIDTKRGSGKGGQHRNKTDSMVVMTHRETGIKASIDGRNQHHNKKAARKIVEERVKSKASSELFQQQADIKRDLAGSGERGDKIRTYRYQDNIVTDHRSGKKVRLSDVLKGELNKLY
jgi:peptide chain release factor 1